LTLRAALLVLLALALAAPAADAATVTYAKPNAPGPALSVPTKDLVGALTCSKGFKDAAASHAPVLLVQGTGATAEDNWSWTYEPAFDKLGIPWCQTDLPDHATGDIQINAQYVVYAIREMHQEADRKIAIVGHSQGGMLPRWALRFWPDTRKLVDDVIGFAPSNHGTAQASQTCGDGECTAADWQQWDISGFVKALNSSAETWAGISYTNVYTHTDEIVIPNSDDTGSSSLHTGKGKIVNVATQDVCPSDVMEHLTIGTIDPVAYALAIDALTHDGPADPKRVPITTCAMATMPGVDPVTGPTAAAKAVADFEGYNGKEIGAEPPLACYVTATCAGSGPLACRPFTVAIGALKRPTAAVNGERVKVKTRGRRITVRVRPKRYRGETVRVAFSGRDATGTLVTVRRVVPRCGA
jgi:triacylglycerol esterase/lipase EstA (alpha/beta hydrolase family)